METYNFKDFSEAGLTMGFVQNNQSMSVKGVLRGLHFQKTFQQDKLVRVVHGEVFDAVGDIREGSNTYGKWYGVILSPEKKNMFYIPEGFIHGFLVLSETAEFTYKLSDYYHPEDKNGIS
jgi:dTDP-4-dehydrorhamnose 3,5-epimerase